MLCVHPIVMGLSIMYISILNWQFFPYFSRKWLNFHIRFVMPNVSVTNRVFKDIYYLFPYSPALDEKSPRRSEPEGNMLEHFIFMFLPQLFSAFFKTFTSFVKYFHGWGPPRVEAREVVFRNSSYTVGFLLFLDPTDVQYLYFVKSVFFRNRLSVEPTSNG